LAQAGDDVGECRFECIRSHPNLGAVALRREDIAARWHG
jgi:hypothetical protein